MENLGHLIFFLTLSIIDCNGQKGVPSASIKDQNNGPAFQDNDNVNIFKNSDLGTSAVVRVIEQCCFNSVSNWLFLT